MTRQDARTVLTQRIIEDIRSSGKLPWQKPWVSSRPTSLSTGRHYNGFNRLQLSFTALKQGYASVWWGTQKAIHSLGGWVNEDEYRTPTPVLFYSKGKKKSIDPETQEVVEKPTFIMRYYFVWNSEQVAWKDGACPKPEPGSGVKQDPIAEADIIIAGYPDPPTIIHSNDSGASYDKMKDWIVVPSTYMFSDINAYYATLFHEITHSTAHQKRLDRDLGGSFGTPLYAREELVAELGACYLCAEAGIDSSKHINQSEAYLQHWLGRLEDDPGMLIVAAGLADKAANWVLNKKEESHDTQQEVDRGCDLQRNGQEAALHG